MALAFDWAGRVVESSESILDLPAFHATLRDAEDSEVAMVHPVIHNWKALDLGGAFVFGLEFINGWTLKFPAPGNYQISGNLNATIVPVAGVYVERKTSSAYVTTSVGASGPTAESVASAVRAELGADLARLLEIARLHGLVEPLVVTPTTRTAGPIHQDIAESGGVVTVTRS